MSKTRLLVTGEGVEEQVYALLLVSFPFPPLCLLDTINMEQPRRRPQDQGIQRRHGEQIPHRDGQRPLRDGARL
jgi:hypothetical protein